MSNYSRSCEETLAHCEECNKYLPMREAKRSSHDLELYTLDYNYFAHRHSMYWDVTFSSGHKARVYTIYNGAWCFSCKSWEINLCEKEKEKKMSWNGKKLWIIQDKDSDLLKGEFESFEEAEREARRLSSILKHTLLVFESVSGFKPKQDTERVKF